MYYVEDKDQLMIEDFSMPFEGKLDPNNRWVRLAGIMPWDHIEEIYLQTMSVETGRRAFPSRIAFGAIFIKESENPSRQRTSPRTSGRKATPSILPSTSASIPNSR